MAKGIPRNCIPDDKRLEIKELLKKVTLSEICDRVGVKPYVVYNALRGRSSTLPALADLQKVVEEARKEYTKKIDLINSLTATV